MTEVILYCAAACIEKRHKRIHPWLTARAEIAVLRKREILESTTDADERTCAIHECSLICAEEFSAYARQIREKLLTMRRGFKQWWKTSDELFKRRCTTSHVPALRTSSGDWTLTPKAKADAFATIFKSKFVLPNAELNEFNALTPSAPVQRALPAPTLGIVFKIPQTLDKRSGTGPDRLPARILKRCAGVLVAVVLRLTLGF